MYSDLPVFHRAENFPYVFVDETSAPCPQSAFLQKTGRPNVAGRAIAAKI